ncbi:MAG: 8-amino-7-oxononanoate synthase [Odoribacter sp.]|nr:8-amino-7-oxononanoate synthase [Odoribacter sp.]
MIDLSSYLDSLARDGNLRRLPDNDTPSSVVDLSSNDYLGLADDIALRERFLASHDARSLLMTSSASRLLAGKSSAHIRFEQILSHSYDGRPALLFNSGYHANTGIAMALGSLPSTIIIADKLVHASVIDGIKLSGAPFERFRHNDMRHLSRFIEKYAARYSNIIIIVESVYSMDGDEACLRGLVDLKKQWPNIILYVDEAHAVGAVGPAGLGCAARDGVLPMIDVLVGTMGKALASMGAYAIVDAPLREFLVNRARSLIFSTALPPAQVEWSILTWDTSLHDDWRRQHLAELSHLLAGIIDGGAPSHIRPLIVGDAAKAVNLSHRLYKAGYKVLPIRTPTVPPGTERLRFSLSAAIDKASLDNLSLLLK